jgi:hypothetical protein
LICPTNPVYDFIPKILNGPLFVSFVIIVVWNYSMDPGAKICCSSSRPGQRLASCSQGKSRAKGDYDHGEFEIQSGKRKKNQT